MIAVSRTPRPFAVTLRMVAGIAVPMTLAYLSTPLIGIVDVAVIGQLGDAALIGAVALGALLFDFLGVSLNFLRSGTTGLVAQAMGAEDREAEAMVLWRALLLAFGAGLLVVVLHRPLLSAFLVAMGPSDAVATATRDYFTVRAFAMPLMLANYAILGWLLGLGRARVALVLQLLIGLTNVAGSVLLVMGLGYGVAGAAAASVFAELVTALAGGVVVMRALGRRPRPSLAAVLERAGFMRMVAVNRDIFVRSMLLIGTFSFFSAVGARFGDVTLAANALLLNIFLLGGYFLDGLATAAEQLTGRSIGAHYRPAFDKTVTLSVIIGGAMAALLALLALVFGDAFVYALTTAEDVRTAALAFLPWAAMTPIAGALAFIMDGIYIGATWSAMMRNMMIVSTLVFLAVWAVAVPAMGNHGLWLALLVFLGARGVTLYLAVPSRANATFGAAG
ncbi:MATE family efflux transporter [Acuticoccus sediminis]|uniref:MATE family efflux transporter n=2 Tax=Acuticoccus sediminis TaxID=2184697 RepID=A0A8B2P0B8_9HYPH|nr:MATE family efflux transporter [Acuticoccus sediminis]RAI03586.1 MATE family efflux transporter [Acuticoccus sediminis]